MNGKVDDAIAVARRGMPVVANQQEDGRPTRKAFRRAWNEKAQQPPVEVCGAHNSSRSVVQRVQLCRAEQEDLLLGGGAAMVNDAGPRTSTLLLWCYS